MKKQGRCCNAGKDEVLRMDEMTDGSLLEAKNWRLRQALAMVRTSAQSTPFGSRAKQEIRGRIGEAMRDRIQP